MSGPGPIVVKPSGSITAPSVLSPSVATALTKVLSRVALPDVILFPSLKAVAVANGYDFQYHLLDGAQYLTGPIGPYTAPTIASSAVNASYTFSATAIADGDEIRVGVSAPVYDTIYFKTTLNTSLGVAQVKRTGTLATDVTNLYKFLNGTGTNGSEYYDG